MSANINSQRRRALRKTFDVDLRPCAYTPEQAAAEIGVPLKTIRAFLRIGWLRPLRPGHTHIGAHLVQRLKQGRPY